MGTLWKCQQHEKENKQQTNQHPHASPSGAERSGATVGVEAVVGTLNMKNENKENDDERRKGMKSKNGSHQQEEIVGFPIPTSYEEYLMLTDEQKFRLYEITSKQDQGAASEGTGASPCSRFRVEERSGVVAVYDTEHPEYHDTPGCHADYPWVVCSWHGRYVEPSSPECTNGAGHWVLDKWQTDKAHEACRLLNANPTGQPPPRLGGGKEQRVVGRPSDLSET